MAPIVSVRTDQAGSVVACLAAMWSCVSAQSWLHIVISVSELENQDQKHRQGIWWQMVLTDQVFQTFQGYKVTVMFGPQTTDQIFKIIFG